tara:strand:+ start:251 stop:724 length:474 start_codon:yes stop_codon:yes gene_type:complete
MSELVSKVYKLRENAILPSRAHKQDAGADIYYCPSEVVAVEVQPGETVVLETGLKVEVPNGYMMQVMNKSGIASKTQLLVGACVVDRGYDGEIFVNLHNVGKQVQKIEPAQKIAQVIFVRIENPDFYETTEDNVYGITTDRGDGGFGSTGLEAETGE